MSIFLTYPSSREYWMQRRIFESLPPSPCAAHQTCTPPRENTWDEIVMLCAKAGFTLPLHTAVRNRTDRRVPINERITHLLSHQQTPEEYVQIAKGVYVESPEMTFIHAAAHLSRTQLIMFGCELCGLFALDTANRYGVRERNTITSPEHIAACIGEHPGEHGVNIARRALPFLIANARSPKEIALGLMLTLPLRFGGYGFQGLRFNHRIVPAKHERTHVSQNYYDGDLVWPDARLVIEYDSDSAHAGRANKDRRRAADLEFLGYQVLSVGTGMMYTLNDIDDLAFKVARRLGAYIRRENRGLTPKRVELFKELINFS